MEQEIHEPSPSLVVQYSSLLVVEEQAGPPVRRKTLMMVGEIVGVGPGWLQ